MANIREIEARRAIESLRAGVPNSTAVDSLGMEQPSIAQSFATKLDSLNFTETRASGFLIEGGFGSGKSHILKFLATTALKRGYANSTITISKETPLGDLSALFRSAIANLTYPDGRVGGTLGEVFDRLDTDSKPFLRFFDAVSSGALGLDPLYRASLMLHERYKADISVVEDLISFWDGGKARVPEWKKLLKDFEYNAPTIRSISDRDLALERFCFASNALKAAGFKGWLITIDEIELIAKFSLRGRGQAYGTLAHVLNNLSRSSDAVAPFRDILFIGAITPDLIGELLRTRDDRTQLRERYDNESLFFENAVAGIEALTKPGAVMPVISATPQQLETALDQVFNLYCAAYKGFADTTATETRLNMLDASRSMRQSVRGWIAYWDLKRTDPSYSPDIVSDTIAFDLSEDEGVDNDQEAD